MNGNDYKTNRLENTAKSKHSLLSNSEYYGASS